MSEEQKAGELREEFEELIQLVLELDPAKYGIPWDDKMLLVLRQLLTKSEKAFPKKSRMYIYVLKKFLFDSGQLIALSAAAHMHAQKKSQEAESLIIKPSFSDLAEMETKK